MSAPFDGRVVAWPGASDVGPADGDERVLVALWLRGSNDPRIAPERAIAIGSKLPAFRKYIDRSELARATDTESGDIAIVTRVLHRYRIEVEAQTWRCVYARGTVAAFARVFVTDVRHFDNGATQTFLRRVSPLRLPPELTEIVRAVVGLDEWPMERAMHRRPASDAPTPTPTVEPSRAPVRVGLRAEDVLRRYNFPSDATGRGQTIGIVRFGGILDESDFSASMAANGAAVPQILKIHVEPMPHDTAGERAFGNELAIDVQVAGALAPGATLALYGTSHGERGFLRAIAAAIFDDDRRPTTLSISYGWRENQWTVGASHVMEQLFVIAALVGTSVFVASGDHGREEDESGDAHVLSPASSRFVIACGATQIEEDDRETQWPQSGGGTSAHVPRPPWQNPAIGERRGLPDLVAQCVPGYRMVMGGAQTYGSGTSAIAPMMAALVARIDERASNPCGFFAPLLYGYAPTHATETIRKTADAVGRSATWTSTMGLGTVDGIALATLLRGDA